MEQPQNYISNLTPLRGAAAIWVFFYHFQGIVAIFIYPAQTHVVELGYLMVDLFFIMSGFIILHVYGDKFSSRISWKNFANFSVARFARIYPLHLFTLIILIIFVAVSNGWSPMNDPKAIPANILLIHSFGLFPIFTWNVPSWSISGEWWAYMAFPLIALLLSKSKRFAIPVLIFLIILTYIAIMFWLPRKDPFDSGAVIPHNLDSTFDYGYLRGLAGFASGMVTYELYRSGFLVKYFRKDWVAFLIILGTLYTLHIKINDGFYIPLFALVVLCFASNVGRLYKICNHRLPQFLGDISYSIYLMQIFVLLPFLAGVHLPFVKYGNTLFEHNAGFWTGLMYFVILLLAIIGLSTLSYKYIEVPCRKWINGKWKKPRPLFAGAA